MPRNGASWRNRAFPREMTRPRSGHPGIPTNADQRSLHRSGPTPWNAGPNLVAHCTNGLGGFLLLIKPAARFLVRRAIAKARRAEIDTNQRSAALEPDARDPAPGLPDGEIAGNVLTRVGGSRDPATEESERSTGRGVAAARNQDGAKRPQSRHSRTRFPASRCVRTSRFAGGVQGPAGAPGLHGPPQRSLRSALCA